MERREDEEDEDARPPSVPRTVAPMERGEREVLTGGADTEPDDDDAIPAAVSDSRLAGGGGDADVDERREMAPRTGMGVLLSERRMMALPCEPDAAAAAAALFSRATICCCCCCC